MSRCDLFKWDLEPGSEILFSCVYRTSFFIRRWEMLMCVIPGTGLERFGKELGLSRSKEYKPWSLHLSVLRIGSCTLNFFRLKMPFIDNSQPFSSDWESSSSSRCTPMFLVKCLFGCIILLYWIFTNVSTTQASNVTVYTTTLEL